ncbi:23S rRNA (pseudouridine(1915)-N(3))-methyltransferase RlmH [Maridesulfovibrio hydrothermalis]|uniref:Ribosomal RNA large subunit methyltransferase H n=1 Tax=Maridesulfovibrio hydrothermalis AM13 = DSM 14728 TaxID=1121451 RepID=L0RA80_9BACT|nr:23S rRNA (pseudouridine(1915)-N(3))-methyltransferase RlmH [Maridesulfovibrio hydrothermalis]CCO23122.1 Ribosomal RNA large subunit methyltransferase H [Maridesulfovibrio hydrothermalis AM13 = DSM 14728]
MSKLRFVWVGKIKEPFFRDACAHYTKKLGRFHKLDETILKDAPGKLPPEEKILREGKSIITKIRPSDMLICMDEKGKEMTSVELSKHLRRWTEDPNLTPCFVIGGPFGLSEEVKNMARVKLSLSKMTLPHELARTMLLEQLYRAASILRGSPYHHV